MHRVPDGLHQPLPVHPILWQPLTLALPIVIVEPASHARLPAWAPFNVAVCYSGAGNG
jgi:hypothetical protein